MQHNDTAWVLQRHLPMLPAARKIFRSIYLEWHKRSCQSFAVTEPKKYDINRFLWRGFFRRLCHWKWLMFSFLKFQRNTPYNASAIEPANGKTR